jgi:hypothetical protein
MTSSRRIALPTCVALLFALSMFVQTLYAGNDVLGEIELVGATKVEKTSGVWVDGQYVGYLKELKGSKKILLLPGQHEITVRQAGYKDFSQKVTVQPGGKQVIRVAMEKDLRMQIPTITAEIKLSVVPDRAAVFVDGLFAGHVASLVGSAERYWSHQENAKLRSVCLDTKLLRLKSTSSQIRNSRSRRSSSRAACRQALSRIRNS